MWAFYGVDDQVDYRNALTFVEGSRPEIVSVIYLAAERPTVGWYLCSC